MTLDNHDSASLSARARPASSCSNRSPLRTQARGTSLRPFTTGSNVTMTNTDGGAAALNGLRARTAHSAPARGLLRPLRSPYEPLGGRRTRAATTGGVAVKSSGNGVLRRAMKRGRMRGREQGHIQNSQNSSVRSMLPWLFDEGSQRSCYKHMPSGDRGDRPRSVPQSRKDKEEYTGVSHALAEGLNSATGALSCGARGGRPQSQEGKKMSPCGGKRQHLSAESDSMMTAPLSSADDLEPSPQLSCASLFEALTPQVPAVDLYILSDSLTFEAINKRGHAEALPVGRVGADGGGKGVGNAPWMQGDRWDDTTADGDALLFPDEDIDKAGSSVDCHFYVGGPLNEGTRSNESTIVKNWTSMPRAEHRSTNK